MTVAIPFSKGWPTKVAPVETRREHGKDVPMCLLDWRLLKEPYYPVDYQRY
jgi:hypothetical protein